MKTVSSKTEGADLFIKFDTEDILWETLTHDGVEVLAYINDDCPVRITFTNRGRRWEVAPHCAEETFEYLDTRYGSALTGMDLLVEVLDKVWFEFIDDEWTQRVSGLPI